MADFTTEEQAAEERRKARASWPTWKGTLADLDENGNLPDRCLLNATPAEADQRAPGAPGEEPQRGRNASPTR